jgi:hypothetical protein
MCFKKNPKPIGGILDLAGYELKFLENFGGNAPVDWSRWTHAYPGGQDRKELTRWSRSACVPSLEGLRLMAYRGQGENICGQLCSWQFMETLYGYIEWSAKMPPKGFLYFPALWGYNKRGHQPEPDCVELAGAESNELWFTYHYVIPPDLLTDHAVGTHLLFPKTDFSKGFHTYGLLWEMDRLTWYVDRKPYFTTTEYIPSVPVFWVMGIQAGGKEGMFKHLFSPEESGQFMTLANIKIYQ